MLSEVWGNICSYMSTNIQLNIFYGRHMCGGCVMTQINHVHLYFTCSFEIFLVYNYAILCYVFLLMCQIFALIVVLKSGI